MSVALPELPAWANLLRERYLAGEANVFILHGNVFDKYRVAADYLQLQEVLSVVLAKKDVILELGLANGVTLIKGEPARVALNALTERGLGAAMQFLEARIRAQPTAVIIPYAATVFPAAETHFLSFEERAAVTTLHRWSLDANVDQADALIILIAESLTALAPALLSNPRIAAIELPLPEATPRRDAVAKFAPGLASHAVQRIAEQTAGLRLVQIESIVSDPARNEGLNEDDRRAFIAGLLGDTENAAGRAAEFAKVTAGKTREAIRNLIAPGQPAPATPIEHEVLAVIRQRKREILEQECAGLIEIIEPRHGLEIVGGNESIKQELMRVAKALRDGDTRRAPMGMLAVGPMGSGKTFVINAFLKEAGLNGIMLKNFRSQWVGATEANLERVLAMLKVMGPVALVIDEGDRSFGSRNDESDGGTSSRVIARLKAFMSEPENRGRILFIMMTNRPDKLDIDIKRPGRLDVKLPFFYAQTAEERAQIMQALLHRYGLSWGGDFSALAQHCAALDGYSNADLEALVLMAASRLPDEVTELAAEVLADAIQDFIPPQDVQMVEYMELLAARECSRKSWLPERLAQMDAATLHARLVTLQQILD